MMRKSILTLKFIQVRCAFDALSFDGVRAAPLWDSDLKSYVGRYV